MECMESLEEQTQMWGLTISVKKTKWFVANSKGQPTSEIRIRGEEVEKVEEFVYLGSVLSVNGASESDIRRRIGLGTMKFMSLRRTVWQHPEISVKTKIQIYRAIVLSTTLYGSENWTCTENGYASLNAFHNKNLRTILGLRWNEIHNEELYYKTGLPSIENLIRVNRLRWAGHVRRMRGIGADGKPTEFPDDSQRVRWPKKVLCGELVQKGNPGSGRPRLDWTDSLKKDLEKAVIETGKWQSEAKDWKLWRKRIEVLSYLPSRRRRGK